MFPALAFPPLEIFIPCYLTLPALISLKFYASPEILCYLTLPSSFLDGAIYSFSLIPALFRNNVG